jgi:prophage antirepressor-like protein
LSQANTAAAQSSILPTRIFRAPNGQDLALIAQGDTFVVDADALAQQLAFAEAKDLVRTLADDEKVLVKPNRQDCRLDLTSANVWIPPKGKYYVTEPGFYRVLGQRNVNAIRDDVAQLAVYRFQRWVFHEVLPQMMRAGMTLGLRPGLAWNWDEVSAQVRQRYGLDLRPTEITNAMRAAGWLKSGECTPKSKYRHHFWHSGTAFLLYPYALPVLVSDMVGTLRGLGDPRVQQEQLEFFPPLRMLEGDAA